MHTPPDKQSEMHRVILLRGKPPEVLVVFDGHQFTFPEIDIPRGQRVAEHLTKAIQDTCGVEGVSLFSLRSSSEPSSSVELRYEVMESWSRCDLPHERRWVAVDSLSFHSFPDPKDSQALARGLAQTEDYASGNRLGPFGVLGWFAELKDWIEGEIVKHGLRLSGSYRQFNTGPRFSLIRFETNGTAVWFKAVGEPNLREYPVTIALSEYFPAFLPEIIATRPEWNGWLAREVNGYHPAPLSGTNAWITAATTLAELQVLSLGHSDTLIEIGCRDMRVTSLIKLIDPFLQVMSDLMAEQTTLSPAPLSREELYTLRTQLFDLFTTIADSGMPDSIGHLDLNPGNIVLSGNRCIFLDWAEACFGPPFSTFHYLLEQFRRFPRECGSWSATVLSAYTEPWRRVLIHDVLEEGLAAAPLLAVFAHAAVTSQIWRDADLRVQSGKKAYLRSLTRRIKREADLLSHPIPRSKGLLHSQRARPCS